MSVWIFAIGVALLVAALLDVLGSLLGDSGRGGWLTGRLGEVTWRLSTASRHRGHHRPSVLVGRALVLATPTVWIVLLWAGWSFVFGSGEGVVDSSTKQPAGLGDTVYFTGYTLFTLGNGEFSPVGSGWQLATALATLSGFAILTMAVTYIIPIIQTAGSRRTTAALIARHGITVAELRRWLRDADDQSVDSVSNAIADVTESHATFPALHYLHASDEHRSAPAMTSLLGLAAIDSEPRPSIDELIAAIDRYVGFHTHANGDERPALRTELEVMRVDDGRSNPAALRHPPDRTTP